MRIPLLALSVLGIAAVAASPAWAPRGPRWNTDAAKAPASVGYCRTNRSQRSHCTVMRNECLHYTKPSEVTGCDRAWRDCCLYKRADDR
jgi:hypothetical protein